MQKLLHSRKKGFTLIELIVVLVILAIMAAILVPTFVKYIDKARKGSVEVEARDVLVAAQSIATEEYGAGNEDLQATTATDAALSTDTKKYIAAVADLAEIDTATNISKITVVDGQVTDITYTSDGYTATYDEAATPKWVVKKN